MSKALADDLKAAADVSTSELSGLSESLNRHAVSLALAVFTRSYHKQMEGFRKESYKA